MNQEIKLLNWYANNKREKSWRGTKDPYKVWLSEIILQQTQVAQGTPYFDKFIAVFPKVKNLAESSEDEVIRSIPFSVSSMLLFFSSITK